MLKERGIIDPLPSRKKASQPSHPPITTERLPILSPPISQPPPPISQPPPPMSQPPPPITPQSLPPLPPPQPPTQLSRLSTDRPLPTTILTVDIMATFYYIVGYLQEE